MYLKLLDELCKFNNEQCRFLTDASEQVLWVNANSVFGVNADNVLEVNADSGFGGGICSTVPSDSISGDDMFLAWPAVVQLLVFINSSIQ